MNITASDLPLAVRATINLPGLRAGAETVVAELNPYVEACLRAGYVVPMRHRPDEQASSDATP